MTDTIIRWECPECRVTWIDPPLVYAERLCEHHAIVCPGVPVERRFIAAEQVERWRVALRDIATRPKVERNPDGMDQAAWTMALIAEDALEEEAAVSAAIMAAINAATKET